MVMSYMACPVLSVEFFFEEHIWSVRVNGTISEGVSDLASV
jgi:hypothetical protein